MIYSCNVIRFKRNLKGILILAFGGVLICAFVFAGELYLLDFSGSVSFSGFLVIGAILGSTDPIAVAALLKECGTPHKVNMLIEGESLINDGASIVLFQTFMLLYENKPVSTFKIVLDLATLCIGGPIIGAIFGFIFYVWMQKVIKDGVLLVSITFINCFLLFFICEFLSWNVSGILALVAASVILSFKGKMQILAEELNEAVDTVWKFSQFVAESLLFIITGIFIGKEGRSAMSNSAGLHDLLFDFLKCILFFVLMNISRYIVVLIFLPFFNDERKRTEYKITWKECIIIAYSGIRGAFPLILCLSIAKNDNYDPYFKQLAMLITITVIFLGIIFNGITIKFIIKYLNLSKHETDGRLKLLLEKEIFVNCYKKFDELQKRAGLNLANWKVVYDLSGLQADKKLIKERSEGRSERPSQVESTNALILAESRQRIIYALKAVIIKQVKESHCSTEAAKILLEICEWSIEDADTRLTLWFHLEELLEYDIYVSFMYKTKNYPFIYNLIKNHYMVELSYIYEALYSFNNFLDIVVMNNKDHFTGNVDNFTYLIREIEFNKKKVILLGKWIFKENNKAQLRGYPAIPDKESCKGNSSYEEKDAEKSI